MSLSSSQLDAFVMVARMRHFSKAAQALHITQSALSQRIRNLESEMGLSLFVRDPAGIQLTEAGTRLLRYCQTKDSLELELIGELKGDDKDKLAGILRLAGYSSTLRSIVLPALAPLLRENPGIQSELFVRETRDLPAMLQSARAEFVVMDYALERAGIEARVIGHEEYVLVESGHHKTRQDVFLDHDPEDTTTERFLRHQGGALARGIPSIRRSYMDEIYGILDGVALGLGRAVVSKHLAEAMGPQLRMVRGHKPLRLPIVLHYHSQPFYSRLHRAVIEALTTV